MKKLLFLLITLIGGCLYTQAQVSSEPTPLYEDSENVWIYFYADQGSKGLMNQSETAAIYAHTGVCTNRGDWRFAPTWLDNSAKYKLEYVSPNVWRLFIGNIREYYGITDPAETVRRLAFVFRDATGSKEGKTATGDDIFLNVMTAGQENPPVAESKPYPGGKPVMGAVNNGNGSVTFCLAAPGKSAVSIIGSWNDYDESESACMYVDTVDGIQYFWQTINGIKDGETYLYYYLVDGSISVGDPYARLVLDPDNDKYIPSSVFPDLPSYPSDKVPNVCLAVYKSDINQYNWKVKDFKGVDKDHLIIYELLLRDFTGTEGQARGDGTVRQAMEKIPYLKSLGVNAVELLPINEFNGNISWGYNPNFYFAPDKAYGTPEDYKAFIDECHAQGIAVILDLVFNQSDGQHPWYKMYPVGENPMYNALAPHAYSVLNDYNQGHPLVKKQWADCVKYWLTEYNVDGFRFDLVKGLGLNDSYANNGDAATNAFNQSRIDNMHAIQLAMNEVKPDAYFINENLAEAREENAMAAFGQLSWSNLNNQGCQFAMGYQTDSGLEGFYAPNWGRTWGSTVSYLESHDEQRLAYKQRTYGVSEVQQTKTAMKRLGSAAAQMLMAPGAHMIWQFSEMGDEQNTKNDDGGNNTDPKTVNWNMLNNPYRAGLVKSYSELAAIRNNNQAIFSQNASFSSACTSNNWSNGRTMQSVSGEGSIYTFINPNVDKAITFSFEFPSKNNSDFKILSTSYGDESTFDASAGKVTVAANCYIVIGTSSVTEVKEIDEAMESEETQYFNMQGMRVSNPARGEIIVVRKGNKTFKAIAE